MNQISRIAVLLFSTFIYGNLFAQTSTYSEKDAGGNKIYYKIMSAAKGYENKCIEDNIRNSAANNHTYLVNDSVGGNLFQEWQIIPETVGLENYYVKNHRSMRFMKNGGTWAGNILALGCGTTNKFSTKAFEFYAIGKGQVVIRYTDADGDMHYLNAVDDAATDIPKLILSRAQNTSYAWKIVNLDGSSATGIKGLTENNSDRIGITVINRTIIVNGTDNYLIYDILGRKIAKSTALAPGTYIVSAEGRSYKIMVK